MPIYVQNTNKITPCHHIIILGNFSDHDKHIHHFKRLGLTSPTVGQDRTGSLFNAILPGLLNTLRPDLGEGSILPPPNSLGFYPRRIKFGM